MNSTDDHPIQMFLAWFDAQGKHVRGHIALVGMGMLPQQSGSAEHSAPRSPLEALQQVSEFSAGLLKSEDSFREWLIAEECGRLRQFGNVLFVRSLVSFLIFRWGHDEGREAVQAKRLKDAEHFERVAGQETDFTRLVRGDPAQYRQESLEWTAASQSWKRLCSTSLSDEVLEGWAVMI